MGSGLVELRDRRARLVIDPAIGAAIVRYDALIADRAVPVFKPAEGLMALGCQLLVPFSNRISGGGFEFEGRFHPVEPNFPGEPFPIHGDGFQKPWRLLARTETETELALEEGAIGPYRYRAQVRYALEDGALAATISVENRAGIRLPYGLGFHPWFPRYAGTLLAASATHVFLEDERHLPAGEATVASRPEWDFSSPKPLPQAWTNNAFAGWDSRATIVQPDDGIAVSLEASPSLGIYLVYSPSREADFFCFEPVSHPVDAHDGEGLMPLGHGEAMAASMRLRWDILG